MVVVHYIAATNAFRVKLAQAPEALFGPEEQVNARTLVALNGRGDHKSLPDSPKCAISWPLHLVSGGQEETETGLITQDLPKDII